MRVSMAGALSAVSLLLRAAWSSTRLHPYVLVVPVSVSQVEISDSSLPLIENLNVDR